MPNRMKHLRRAYPFLFVLLAGPVMLRAQDSLSNAFTRDSLAIMQIQRARPQFRFDNRITFYEGQSLAMNGFDAGVLLSERLRVTLGYYQLDERLDAYTVMRNEEEFSRSMRLSFGSLNTELIYKDARFYSLGMPLELAAGLNTFKDRNETTGEVTGTESGAILFVNFGISGTFKPMRFLGLKAMLGYRKTVFNQVKNFNFDGFFTSVGLNIDVHEIVSDIRMFRLKKRYHRGNNVDNAVKILTE